MTISHKGDSMTVKCWPGNISDKIKNFIYLEIRRCVGDNCHEHPTAKVIPGNKAVLEDPTLKERATVTGKADDSDVIGSFVQVVFRPVTFKDAGRYICDIFYYGWSTFSQIVVLRDINYVTACSKYTFICLMVW